MSPRPPTKLLLCLTLGALTTLALAWSLAAFVPIPMYPRTTLGSFMRWGRPWSVGTARRPGVVDMWWGDMRNDYPTLPPDEIVHNTQDDTAKLVATRPGSTVDNTPPRWGTFAAPAAPPKPIDIGSDSAFGWPMPCLWYQVLGTTSKTTRGIGINNETLHGGRLIGGDTSARGRDFHALPLRPIWTGLLVDTAAFSLLWAALLLPSAIRRRLRLRRGHCPACGYDRAGLPAEAPCPECGHVARASPPVSPHP